MQRSWGGSEKDSFEEPEDQGDWGAVSWRVHGAGCGWRVGRALWPVVRSLVFTSGFQQGSARFRFAF